MVLYNLYNRIKKRRIKAQNRIDEDILNMDEEAFQGMQRCFEDKAKYAETLSIIDWHEEIGEEPPGDYVARIEEVREIYREWKNNAS